MTDLSAVNHLLHVNVVVPDGKLPAEASNVSLFGTSDLGEASPRRRGA